MTTRRSSIYQGVVTRLDGNKVRARVEGIPETAWAQPLGAVTTPKEHDVVWILFEGGDVEHPLWSPTFSDVVQAVEEHEAESDPHPIYLTQIEADALFLTQAEADALYEDLGSTATHEGAADPHAQYQTSYEVNGQITSLVTKPFVDALDVDAGTLDGIDSTGFSTSEHEHPHVGGLVKNPTFELDWDWWRPVHNGALQLDGDGNVPGWSLVESGVGGAGSGNYFAGKKYALYLFDGVIAPTTNAPLMTATQDHLDDSPSLEQIPFLRDVDLNVVAWVGKRGTWSTDPDVIRPVAIYYDAAGVQVGVPQVGPWWTASQIASLTDTADGNLTPIGEKFGAFLLNSSFRDARYVRVGVEINAGAYAAGETRHVIVGQVHAGYAIQSAAYAYHRCSMALLDTTMAASTWTKANWTSVQIDGGWGSGVDLVCPAGGLYVVSAYAHWESSATRAITAITTGSGNPTTGSTYSREDNSLEGGNDPMQNVTGIIAMNTGTVLNMQVWCSQVAELGNWSRIMIARLV